MDIVDEILRQHDEQRRGFARLDELEDGESEALAALWDRLAHLLEVHAEAEERFFYPHLLRLSDAAADEARRDETADAIKDHNDIRDAVAHVREFRPGEPEWRAAVQSARKANSDHMAEEERDDLRDFRRVATLTDRHRLAVAFLTYEAAHPLGGGGADKDPERYIARND